MRYAIALAVAVLLIVGGLLLSWRLRASVLEELQQAFRAEQQAGRLPAELRDVDADTVELTDFDWELSSGAILRLNVSDAIRKLWFAWMPLVVLLCLAVAYLIPTAKAP